MAGELDLLKNQCFHSKYKSMLSSGHDDKSEEIIHISSGEEIELCLSATSSATPTCHTGP